MTAKSINSGTIKSVVLRNALTTENGMRSVEISDLVTEFDIYQSIQVPFMTGKLLIVDGISLLDSIMLIGNEQVDVTIETKSTSGEYEKIDISFISTGIEKLEKRGNTNAYILSLGSAHFVANAHKRINQAYEGSSSEIIKNILVNDLKLTENQLDIEQTTDNKKMVVPALKIADALMWITRRAYSESKTPCFIYEYLDGGMGFNSLKRMYDRDAVFSYYRVDSKSTDPKSTYYQIIDVQFDNVGSGYKNMSNGMYSAKVYAFDVMTKQMIEKDFNLLEDDSAENLLNDVLPTPSLTVDEKTFFKLPDNKIYELFTSSDGSNSDRQEITGVNELIGDYHTNAEHYVPYMNSKLMQLENYTMTITVEGNVNIFPGAIINIVFPSTSNLVKGTAKQVDNMYTGKYLVTGIRHIITSQNHLSYVQVAKDSFRVGAK